jgi:putative hemolysin
LQSHQRHRSSRLASAHTVSDRSDSDPLPERQRRARSVPRDSDLSNRDARATSETLFPRGLAFVVLTLTLLAANGLLFAQSNSSGTQTNTETATASFASFSPLSPGLAVGLIALLLLFHAFLTTAELALITIRRTRLRQLVEEGNRRALLIERMLEQPTRLMATTQTGVMLTVTLSAAFAAFGFVPPLAHWLDTRTDLSTVSAFAAALLLVLPPVAVLSQVLGEIAPRSLVLQRSERLALLTVRPIRGLQILLAPVVALVTFCSNLLLRPFGGTASFTTPAANEEELKMMVEASEEQGVLEAEETEMIHSVLDFAGTVVRKVMTPRIDLTGVNINAPLPELVRIINASGHSRIPIYEGELDNIVGIVHAKDLLPLLAGDDKNDVPIRDVMRPPYFIPETKKVEELLAEFRRSKQQIAIVRDEYGITAGIVTIEDLVEEIVGDIQDEYDVDEPMVQVINETTTILDGKMGLDDVNERMGLEIPEDEADTIGGFVFGLLGHQAEQGECVVWENVKFMVEATDGKRITKVRVIRQPEKNKDDSGSPPSEAAVVSRPSPTDPRRDVEISGVEIGPGVLYRR